MHSITTLHIEMCNCFSFVTGDAYRRVKGTCVSSGNILKEMTVSLKICRNECDAHSECNEFEYHFSRRNRIVRKACTLKMKMCQVPRKVKSRNVWSFFPINIKGKLL